MGILERIRGWIGMLFKQKAKEDFRVNSISSDEMQIIIDKCERIYQGIPEWVDAEENIKTINFAKIVCSEIGRLSMLGTSIKIDGSKRAEWLQKKIDDIYHNIRIWVEYGSAYGTIILKPNGTDIDIYTPDKYMITDQSNGNITGIVFMSGEISEDGKTYYTRLEYHRFLETGEYAISNKCYKSTKQYGLDKTVSIEKTPWADLEEEVYIEHVDGPMYATFLFPQANNKDINSPLSLPIFSEAIEELKDLDVAYSRNSEEIYDSARVALVDDRLTQMAGKPVNGKPNIKLPRYAKNVYGNDQKEFYQEINPSLNTEVRLTGINALLSQIGFKCGFSNGYFVFNEKTGMITATQVESDDRRTIQTVKDVRDQLEKCLKSLIYALNVFADLYDYAPSGEYETAFDFGDITYNREEDKARWYGYVTAGKIPFWYYLVKFEGYTEEEAKMLEEEAKPKEQRLFGDEE